MLRNVLIFPFELFKSAIVVCVQGEFKGDLYQEAGAYQVKMQKYLTQHIALYLQAISLTYPIKPILQGI